MSEAFIVFVCDILLVSSYSAVEYGAQSFHGYVYVGQSAFYSKKKLLNSSR